MTPATAPATRETLARAHPEWTGWLRLLDAAAAETRQPHWRDAAAAAIDPSATPRFATAIVTLNRASAERWTRRVLRLAGDAGEAAEALGAAVRNDALEVEALLEAALRDDGEALDAVATSLGVPAAPLRAVAPVLVMPLLLATPPGEARAPSGACPTCGAWPALAEARGLERARRLRCARCGDDWSFDWLRCPFCDEHRHERLGALTPETTAETRRIETCLVCRGYVKTLTALTPAARADVAVLDLATVDLDVAALERGFRRPARLAAPLQTRVVLRARGFTLWKR